MNSSSMSSSNFFNSHPFPIQLRSRQHFVNNSNNTITKLRLKCLSNKKTTRLPPIAGWDRHDSPPATPESFKFLNQSLDSIVSKESEVNYTIDPNIRIKQLEKNIEFVKQDFHLLLDSLHTELQELKTKNRDLQFELTMNEFISHKTSQRNQSIEQIVIRDSLDQQIVQHIHELQNEINRLRSALEDSLKVKSVLRIELQKLKDERKQSINVFNNWLSSSPTFAEFGKTYEEIQRTDKECNQMENTITLPRITNTLK